MRRSIARIVIPAAVAGAVFAAPAAPALAAGHGKTASVTTGNDVSYPQCGP